MDKGKTSPVSWENFFLYVGSWLALKLFVAPWLVSLLPFFAVNCLFNLVWLTLTWLFCREDRISPSALGFAKADVGRQALLGLALGLALLGLVCGGATFMNYAPSDYLSRGAATPLALCLNLLYFLALVGPAEELAFRGYLLHSLTGLTRSPLAGALLSSLLFSLTHIWGGSLTQVIFTFCFGLALSLSMQRVKGCTLLSVIICHSVYNAGLEIIRYLFC